MKTNVFMTMALTVLMAVTLTACGSDDNNDTTTVAPSQGTRFITVRAGRAASSSINALSISGSGDSQTLNATWTKGDVVKVYQADGTEVGSMTAQSNGSSTDLTGCIDNSIVVGEELTLKYLSTNYDAQDGTLTGTEKSIDKVCDYATATIKVTQVTSTNVNTTGATFANQQAVIKFTMLDTDGDPIIAKEFTVSDGTRTVKLSNIPEATYTKNGQGVLYVAFPINGKVSTLTFNATEEDNDKYTFKQEGFNFENGKYYWSDVNKVKMQLLP